MTNTVMVVADAHKEILILCRDIRIIADAFAVVGNSVLSEQLFEIAVAIISQAKIMQDAHGSLIHESFLQSEQNSKNLLAGVLAGMEIGKESAGKPK